VTKSAAQLKIQLDVTPSDLTHTLKPWDRSIFVGPKATARCFFIDRSHGEMLFKIGRPEALQRFRQSRSRGEIRWDSDLLGPYIKASLVYLYLLREILVPCETVWLPVINGE
jgi:hypothetical protein